jgi:hypothetical protein
MVQGPVAPPAAPPAGPLHADRAARLTPNLTDGPDDQPIRSHHGDQASTSENSFSGLRRELVTDHGLQDQSASRATPASLAS